MEAITWVIPIAGLAAIAFALYLAWDVLNRDKGPQAMQDVGDTIREGADAFVRAPVHDHRHAGPRWAR